MAKPSSNKVKNLFKILLLLFVLASLWYINTFTLTVSNVEITDSRINNKIRIVHVTDLHGAQFGKDNGRLLTLIEEQSPDIVVVTGDMYTKSNKHQQQIATDFMRSIANKFLTYYVNGEHDNEQHFKDALTQMGVRVLHYSSEILKIGNTELNIMGTSRVYYSPEFTLTKYFKKDSSRYSVLLAHIEYFDKFSDFGVDLSLCGDTHGGQVRLPFVGAIYKSGIWFPELKGGANAYTKGLYEQGESKLFISSGLGNRPLPIRFLNRPEIAVIDLLPEQ